MSRRSSVVIRWLITLFVIGLGLFLIWKFIIRVQFADTWLNIYELLPAFIFNLVLAVIISLATKAPSKEVTDTFEQVKVDEKA